MKRLALVLLALPALAAADFRASAPIQTTGSDAFHRVPLPVEVYREARRDLADVRVLNAGGEPVPMAFAGEEVPEREEPIVSNLPVLPITTPVGAVESAYEMRVHFKLDGTLMLAPEYPRFPRYPSSKPPPPPKTSFYLLDASQVKYPIGALDFDWEMEPGAEAVRVSLEESNDLAKWRTLVSRAPLVRVEHGGHVLAQQRITLSGPTAKYFRVTWGGGPFNLKSVRAESAPKLRPPVRQVASVSSPQRTPEGDLVYDLGARLPVESLRVVFPEPNSVTPYEIAFRDGGKDARWQTIASATFYRIVRDGAEIVSPPVDIGRRAAREWRLRPQVKGAASDAAPTLQASWRPAEVVFVAKGSPPYTLAFADATATANALPVVSLIPGYEPGAEQRIALASLGTVRLEAPDTASWRQYLGGIPPRKAALWAVLIVGVFVLGFMAWRLLGQMKN